MCDFPVFIFFQGVETRWVFLCVCVNEFAYFLGVVVPAV